MLAGALEIPCVLGRSGITTQKREGDGATPAGGFRLLYGFFRKDRNSAPQSIMQFHAIDGDIGWCDEPLHRNYNQPVTIPFPGSHEKMMREDRLYDICIVLDYNLDPRQRNAGSAIFFHQTSPDCKPTEGCIAIDPEHMRRLLPMLGPNAVIKVSV